MRPRIVSWIAITTFITLLLALGACDRAADTSSQQSASSTIDAASETATRLPDVDVGRIQRDAEFLANDELAGRDTGSEGFAAAAAYVAAAMEAAGLDPGGSDGYFQPVPYLKNQLLLDSAQVVLHTADGDITLTFREDFVMGGDRVRGAARVRAPLVFAGYGIVAQELGVDDFADIDAEGKIIVVLSGAPPSFPSDQRAYYSSSIVKAEIAVAQGAVGVLGVRTLVDRVRVPWDRIKRFAGRPGMSWLSTSGEASRFYPQIEGSASLSPNAADSLMRLAGQDPETLLAAAEDGSYSPFDMGLEATLIRHTEHDLVTSPNVIVTVLPGLAVSDDVRLASSMSSPSRFSASAMSLAVSRSDCPAPESQSVVSISAIASPTVVALVRAGRLIGVSLGRRPEATLSKRASSWRSVFGLISFSGGSKSRTVQPIGAHSSNAAELASTSASRSPSSAELTCWKPRSLH